MQKTFTVASQPPTNVTLHFYPFPGENSPNEKNIFCVTTDIYNLKHSAQ